MDPEDIRVLGDVEGKNVLCLACGGGQQSTVLSLLGGHVTVVDFAQGQLAADREAAAHYGYEVRTIHGDMRDLSCLEAGFFDVVWGTATCYVPSIREVYTQVARVLKAGGLYRTDIPNPATVAIEWDGEGYRISKLYAEDVIVRDAGVYEFRHYFDDIFNGLFDLSIRSPQKEDLTIHIMLIFLIVKYVITASASGERWFLPLQCTRDLDHWEAGFVDSRR